MENVEFARDGSFAYRPGELLVPEEYLEATQRELAAFFESLDEAVPEYAQQPDRKLEADHPSPESGYVSEAAAGFVEFSGVRHLLAAIDALRRAGIPAQPNHVLFATCGCGCPPHPTDPRANPFYANPFYANPFYANPFYANPFYANPFYANPFYANPNPGLAGASGGRRESSARPAEVPDDFSGFPDGKGPVRVTVLDTGYSSATFTPMGLTINIASDEDDVPDEDNDDYLDAAAGHGTFIAGVIQQLTSACDVTVKSVLSTHGDGDENAIAAALTDLATGAERPHFVNLSFGGYSPLGMGQLAKAVEALVAAGIVVVASAGNDATCSPIYPAALPGVIGVAALDDADNPAPFSNYGPWVRACTLGVEVVSSFFREFDGAESADGQGTDVDSFDGWAMWSGTSFAAPRVVAALAERVAAGSTPREAVRELIDDPERARMPMMGTIVEPSGDHWITVRSVSERRDP